MKIISFFHNIHFTTVDRTLASILIFRADRSDISSLRRSQKVLDPRTFRSGSCGDSFSFTQTKFNADCLFHLSFAAACYALVSISSADNKGSKIMCDSGCIICCSQRKADGDQCEPSDLANPPLRMSINVPRLTPHNLCS
jgi:hypothetical protein